MPRAKVQNTVQEPLLTMEEIAARLRVCYKTVRNYLKDGEFLSTEYVKIQRGERVQYRFYERAISGFLSRHAPPQEEKRVYNKRVQKYARKKPSKKV